MHKLIILMALEVSHGDKNKIYLCFIVVQCQLVIENYQFEFEIMF